mgnify:CR=1 FL=1
MAAAGPAQGDAPCVALEPTEFARGFAHGLDTGGIVEARHPEDHSRRVEHHVFVGAVGGERLIGMGDAGAAAGAVQGDAAGQAAEAAEELDQAAARGFIKVWSLPLTAEARRKKD